MLRPYRMDTGFLYASLQYLLTTDHLAILLQNDNKQIRQDFFLEIIPLAKLLPYHSLKEIEKPLTSLEKEMEPQENALIYFFASRKKENQKAKILPWLIVLLTLMLCLVMFWYGQR